MAKTATLFVPALTKLEATTLSDSRAHRRGVVRSRYGVPRGSSCVHRVMRLRPSPALLLSLVACDLPDHDAALDDVDPRGGKQEEAPTVSAKQSPKLCSELAYEGVRIYPPGHQFVAGVADLPLPSNSCSELGEDADHDGVLDGQAYCDQQVGGPQGLPAGATHFVTFDAGAEGLQCGCTCGERPACDQPGQYTNYDAVGGGTYVDPYEIYSGPQLRDLAGDPAAWDRNYVQCNDIDLAGQYTAQRPYFLVPEFSGSYDGRGHQLRHFTWDAYGPFPAPGPAPTDIGLFSRLSGAVSRLSLVDARVRVPSVADRSTGALAGALDAADVWSVSVTGEIDGADIGAAGGLAGVAYDSHLTDITVDVSVTCITAGGVVGISSDSHSRRVTATVDLVGEYVGGFASHVGPGSVSQAHIVGTIEGKRAAGAVQYAYGAVIRRVAADVDVVASDQAAGLVNGAFGTTIEQSRASGAVHGDNQAGGLINFLSPVDLTPAIVRDSFATGNVNGTNKYGKHGGFVASAYDATIERCYSVGDVQTPNYWPGTFGGYIGTTATTQSFSTGAAFGLYPYSFAWSDAPIDLSNRYNSDVNPITPDQGTPASLASGVFSNPNASFGYAWPTGPGGWTFTAGQLPQLTDVP